MTVRNQATGSEDAPSPEVHAAAADIADRDDPELERTLGLVPPSASAWEP